MNILAFAVALAIAASALAACPDTFASGTQPNGLAVTLLCNQSYATGYSTAAREPLWSAEHLTEEELEQAEALPGRAQFHEDTRLPVAARSELPDYKRSGWTRGHMSPAGDAPTRQARDETFLLSNIVPQADRLNSGAWNEIERNVRDLATREGEAYVVTGPAFHEALGAIGPDHVRVPSSVWKAVYIPSLGQTTAVVCRNVAPFRCVVATIAAVSRITGVRPFPGVTGASESPELGAELLR